MASFRKGHFALFALVLLNTPPALAWWGGRGWIEPDTAFDAHPGFSFVSPS